MNNNNERVKKHFILMLTEEKLRKSLELGQKIGEIPIMTENKKNSKNNALFEIYEPQGAYNGARYISFNVTKENTLLYEAVDWEVPSDEQGGYIVLSTDVNAVQIDQNRLLNKIKQFILTWKQRLTYNDSVDKVAQKHNLPGWTVGKALKGRYTGKNGKVYSENSITIKIVGVSSDKLIEIAEDLCAEFNQESVLVRDENNGKTLFINATKPIMETSKISRFGGLRLLSEANLNHIMKNAEKNGIIIISGNRDSIESENEYADLSKEYEQFLQLSRKEDSVELRDKWLADRNKKAFNTLYEIVKKSPYSYSQVYGGFKGGDNVLASYEPSFLIYSVDRNGNQLPFEDLFEFGKELCRKFNQESFFGQAPGKAPNHYNADGVIQNTSSSKFVKFNREGETYFTTAKKEKGDTAQRFTSDIIYENYAKEYGIDYINRIRRTQWGETLLV